MPRVGAERSRRDLVRRKIGQGGTSGMERRTKGGYFQAKIHAECQEIEGTEVRDAGTE